jgi:hypothetical protein
LFDRRNVAMKKIARIMLLIGALSISAISFAASLAGQRFDDRVTVANQELVLNGLGVRSVFFIKGYVAALYLPQLGASFRDVSAMKGAKRLQLRMLRAAEPEDFIEALVEGIEENSNATELVTLKDRIAQLEKTIKIIGAARVDDTINFDFVPNVGTTLAVNGVRKGSAIEGADFYDAVLKIFIGSFPVQGPLKEGLLGKLR